MDVNFTLDTIETTAKDFLALVKEKKSIAFYGEMGAGKTTFIQAICKVLGVKDTISSPTFSIINEYKTGEGEIIYHFDLYRLKNEQEAMDAGVEDALYSGNRCMIEWPEKAPGLLPEDTVRCYLQVTGNNERKLKINL